MRKSQYHLLNKCPIFPHAFSIHPYSDNIGVGKEGESIPYQEMGSHTNQKLTKPLRGTRQQKVNIGDFKLFKRSSCESFTHIPMYTWLFFSSVTCQGLQYSLPRASGQWHLQVHCKLQDSIFFCSQIFSFLSPHSNSSEITELPHCLYHSLQRLSPTHSFTYSLLPSLLYCRPGKAAFQ